MAMGVAMTVEMPEMDRLAQKRDQAEQKSYDKTDQVDRFPGHEAFLVSGPARRPVSNMLCNSERHLRESSWRAIASSARLTLGSLRKRCAPSISQRSSRSSQLAISVMSSV